MAILTRRAILAAVERGDVVIDPFDPALVGPNSVDLHLAPALLRWDRDRAYAKYRGTFLRMDTARDDADCWAPVTPRPDGSLLLEPNTLYLGTTREATYTPKHVPYLDGRSSLGRLGVSLHVTAGRGDTGFRGRWTCEVFAVQAVLVRFDKPWCQLTLHTVEGEVDEYVGRYQGQGDATPSRI